LKLIGKVENVTYNGLWLIRSEITPKIGSKVYNQQKLLVGKISSIIGPIENPYLLVKPTSKEYPQQLQIIGEQLFIIMEKRKSNKK
jgi:rRNA processing protein Gar1